jgi:hypothetical protein
MLEYRTIIITVIITIQYIVSIYIKRLETDLLK